MRLSRWYHFWGRLSNLSMLFENSSLLAINWMKHSMQSIDSELWVVWPGEKGVAPGFRGFCDVGISFWVFLLENHAASFDDSLSFTLCGLTSRSWLLMNSRTQYMGSSIGKCDKYSCSNLSSSSMAFARAAVMTASHSERRNSKCTSSLRFFLSSANSFSWRFFSSYSMAKADFIFILGHSSGISSWNPLVTNGWAKTSSNWWPFRGFRCWFVAHVLCFRLPWGQLDRCFWGFRPAKCLISLFQSVKPWSITLTTDKTRALYQQCNWVYEE